MTGNSRWNRVQELFEILEAMPDHERGAYLEREEPDPEVRAEALDLVLAARLEKQAASRIRGAPRPEPAGPAQIEGITILSALGSGGFGSVYSALRRVNEAEQRVAVKLFHGHSFGPDERRRFEREQKMLASLNHSGIVRFLDAGVTGDGRPFLVMEEVEGEPITAHCDRRRLGVGERLRLAGDAARALQYAHQRLIVHLDLKPSNMLVTSDGQVKLLDFGTAKLMDETGAPTITQQITPLYASPERLRGEPGSVGCDIYSLGLVLYELLSGGWPFPDRASITAIADRARDARDTAPLALRCTGGSAEARGVTAERLRKALQGDLQAICSKMLAFDPAERYSSMQELAEDIRRYQAGQPVLAHPPGFLYRARKFAGRNARTLALAAVAAAVLAGAGVYSWRERLQGAQRLEEARSMAKYLLFDLYDRVQELPGSTAVRARMAGQAQSHLDRLAQLSGAGTGIRLETAAGYNRLAEVQGVSGSSSLGSTQAAAENLDKARLLIGGILEAEPRHRDALIERARNALLRAKLENWNRRNPAAARPLIEQARADLDQTRNLQEPNWLRARLSLAVQQADLAEFERNYAAEKALAQAALAEMESWPANLRSGADHVLRRVALFKRQGNAEYYQGQFEQALAAYREARRILREFDSKSPNRPEVLYALMDMSYQMGYCFGELKQPRAMIEAARESIETGRKLLDYDRENQALHRSWWNKRQALAEGLAALGRLDEAVREQSAVVEAREAARRTQMDSNLAAEDVLVSRATLAGMLAKAGQRERACKLARETIEISRTLHQSGGMTAKNWAEQQRMLDPVLGGCEGR